ncbi:unnamed protein product, partial [Effrenium voratum]
VLPPYLRVIQGDGISYESLQASSCASEKPWDLGDLVEYGGRSMQEVQGPMGRWDVDKLTSDG